LAKPPACIDKGAVLVLHHQAYYIATDVAHKAVPDVFPGVEMQTGMVVIMVKTSCSVSDYLHSQ
jgi:hypothetical protein